MRAAVLVLALCAALLCSAARAEVPDAAAAAATDDDMKAAIDAAVQEATQTKKKKRRAPGGPGGPSAQAGKAPPPATNMPRARREPRDFFHLYSQDDAAKYPELSRRHLLVFSPPAKLAENEALMLEAAETILNPPAATHVGEKGGNTGGGKVLFLLVDTSDPANAPIMHRCSVPTKTSKSGVLRLAQFPSTRPLEIFKPVGKYKTTAKFMQAFLSEVRQEGPGATRALMSEYKVKDFSTLDTSPTLLRAVGATANFLVKRPDDVVLFTYLPSCVHCQQFNETFLAVAQECAARRCGVKFVLLDGSLNEHALVSPMPTTFPQVHMFKAHEKGEPVAFDNYANKVRGFRHFVDSTRWFKDQPKLTQDGDTGFALWDEEVDAMDAKHFNVFLSKVPVFVVMFYTDKSPQSKLTMPEFAKAGAAVGFDRMPLIKIDCDARGEHDVPLNTKLCGLFELEGYPSIVHVDTRGYQEGDAMSQYSELLDFGKYNAHDIAQWLAQKISAASENAARRVAMGKERARAEL